MAARVSPEESGILPAITSTTRADSKPEEKAEKIQEAEEHPAIVRKSIKQREQEMKDELERRAAVAEKEICERLTEELTAKFANEWKASVDLEKERVEALRERLKNVELDNKNLKNTVEEAKADVGNIADEVVQLQEQKETIIAEAVKKEAELHTLIAEQREDIEAKSRRIANLDIQLTKAVDKSETLEQNLATTKIEGDRQQAELQRRCDDVKKELATCEAELRKSKAECQQLILKHEKADHRRAQVNATELFERVVQKYMAMALGRSLGKWRVAACTHEEARKRAQLELSHRIEQDTLKRTFTTKIEQLQSDALQIRLEAQAKGSSVQNPISESSEAAAAAVGNQGCSTGSSIIALESAVRLQERARTHSNKPTSSEADGGADGEFEEVPEYTEGEDIRTAADGRALSLREILALRRQSQRDGRIIRALSTGDSAPPKSSML